jgi:predicted DCC family thiol-disulfide oxidoreductase YuxK
MSQDSVIFDGNCGVCMALKDWAVGRDSAGNLEFVAYQTGNLADISPGLTPELASQALYFVGRDGQRFHGARAVFETMRRLPGLWGVLGTVLSFPPLSFMAEPFYYFFARNRGRFSHWLGLDRCEI